MDAPRLEITLLGGFGVAIAGQRVPDAAWRQRRAAAVVKLLALAPNHYQHREQLIDTLWPELDLEAAANNLRVALHHARRQLTAVAGDAAAAFLTREGDGLRLGPPDQVWTDVGDFETAVARVWQDADFSAANRALDRYRGELLPEDRYEDWVADRRTVLRAGYVTLLARTAAWHEERADLDLAIAARQRQVAADPLDEAAHAALIRLFGLTGRPRQARDQYERLAALLDREVGAAPERATTELWEAIRDGRLPAATPAPLEVEPEPEPVRTGSGLPAPVDDLIGRDRELAELRHLLRGSRLLALTGPGGVGKTRLAIAVARSVATAYPGGAWFVDLAPLTDPDLALPAIARAVGARETAGEALFERVATHLGEAQHLILIDNVEHLIAASPVIGDLLATCAGLTVLLTSRFRLRLRGEQEYPVQPLPLPDEAAADDQIPPLVSAVGRVPAVALFTRRAREARPDFELTDHNVAAVATICRRLDGLPLALEMAASRIRLLTPPELARRLEQPLAILSSGTRDAPARQRTLRATIAWSYDLLQPDAQTLFANLAVFAGGATLDAIEAVASDVGDAYAVFDGVAALVDASLLRQLDDATGQSRLAMLATIRDYARERLEAGGEAAVVRQRHADHFLALAETAAPELTGAEQAAWLDRLELEHDNLRAALTAFDRLGQPRAKLQLAAALWRFWWTRGYLSEGRRWLEQALAGTADGAGRVRATALDGAGALAEAQGEFPVATARHEAALAIWRRLDDLPGQIRSLMNLGLVADIRGEPRQAVRHYEQALTLARKAGDRAGIAGCLANLGFATLDQGRHDAAAAYFGESLGLFRALGDRRNLAAVLDGLGILAFLGGDYQRAAALQAEALAQFRALDDRQGMATALANLGHTTQLLGDLARAERLFADARALYQELGDQSGLAFVLTHLGRLARLIGDPGRAEALLHESGHLAWQIGERTAVIEAMEGLAAVALDRGDATQTARLLGAAGALREATGVPLPAVHQTEHHRCLDGARARLGEAAFLTAWDEGRTLLPEQTLPALAGPE